MKKVFFIYDSLVNYNLSRRIVKNLRQLFKNTTEKTLDEIRGEEECTTDGNYQLKIDQYCYLGSLLIRLGHLFSSKEIADNSELIYDLSNAVVNQAIDDMAAEQGITLIKTDVSVYKMKFEKYL